MQKLQESKVKVNTFSNLWKIYPANFKNCNFQILILLFWFVCFWIGLQYSYRCWTTFTRMHGKNENFNPDAIWYLRFWNRFEQQELRMNTFFVCQTKSVVECSYTKRIMLQLHLPSDSMSSTSTMANGVWYERGEKTTNYYSKRSCAFVRAYSFMKRYSNIIPVDLFLILFDCSKLSLAHTDKHTHTQWHGGAALLEIT